MRISLICIFTSIVYLLLPLNSSMGQESTLTIRLTGTGAVMGRLVMQYEHSWEEGVQLVNCPFKLEEYVTQYEPLSTEQTTCVAQIPAGSAVWLTAPSTSLTSSDGWIVDFSAFGGEKCISHLAAGAPLGNSCQFTLSEASAEVTAEFVAAAMPVPTPTVTPTATFTPTATATPSPKEVADDYVESSTGIIADSLSKLSIRKLAKTKRLKINLGNAPGTGVFRVSLTAKVKKNVNNAATMGALMVNLVLASVRQSVQQGSPVTANMNFSSKGRSYLSGRSSARATLNVRYTPKGGGAVSSLLRKVVIRKR